MGCGNFITDRPSTGLHAPPGGHSSICLGESVDESQPVRKISSNAFAQGADQNCGNVITDRSTTRLHAPPGGHSSVSFGADSHDVLESQAKQTTSSNAFAQGANQNCGNVITDRSSTRLHAPPGGRSSISFETDDAAQSRVKPSISSNVFAQGANQNCGNVITDRSSTRLHAPPGGRSSISLGTDNQDQAAPTRKHGKTQDVLATEKRVAGKDFKADLVEPTPTPTRAGSRATPGGASSVVFG